jgi:hypothetical protein
LSIPYRREPVNSGAIPGVFIEFDKNGPASLSTGEKKPVEVPSGVRNPIDKHAGLCCPQAAIKLSKLSE